MKNSLAGGKVHPPASKNNGQSGKGGAAAGTRKLRSKSEQNSKKDSTNNRGCFPARSPKRSPPRDSHPHHGKDSYNNQGRERSKSRPRREDNDDRDQSRPRSILKKVRFPQGKGDGKAGDKERGNQRRGRGDRGDAPSASKRGSGESS